MSYFPEMEWSSKWEWDNLDAYGSKAMENAKKLQLAGWMLVDGEIATGSFNLSGGGNTSGASASDGGNGSSGKSSLSASTDSSTRDVMQTPKFSFMGFNGSTLNFGKMKGSEVSGTSPPLEASVGSFEPVMGLKLGKRTYFENNGNVKSTPLSVIPTPSSTVVQKKTKSSGKIANIPRCQVEGCDIDLSTFKEYHQKHRVCDTHSKCPKVVIGGHERRFCQQCSRFHSLAEFDEKKRSCRRRLSDHNARRRKPPQEAINFNSSRISSPFYDGRQQLSFLLNNSALTHSASPASSTWDNACNSKFTLTKDYDLKSSNNSGTDKQLHMSGIQFQHVTNMQGNPANGLWLSKSLRTDVLDPGTKGSQMISSHLDAAPAYRRALSLLSNNSWGSCGQESATLQSHEKDIYTTQQPMINSMPQGVPLSCSGVWPTGQHLNNHPPIQSLATNSNFQEFQLLDMPDFYSNILN